MATPTSKEDVLSFGVLVDIRASLKAMEKFSRSMKKSMKTIAESGERMGKQSSKTAKGGKKDTDEWADSLENLNQKYEYQNELLKKRGDTLRALRKLSGDNSAQIQVLEKEFKQMVGAMKAAKHLKERGGAFARSVAPKGMKKAFLAAGEELKNPLQNFLKKDAHGLVEDAGRMFTKGLGRSFHGARLLSRVGGARLQKKGAQKIAAGEFGGAAIKKTGDMLRGLSKLIRPLAPILSAVGVGLVAIVKLLVDADAMVKEFNKGILDSASNVEFLERAGGSAMGAIDNMGNALEGVRDAALDPRFNNALGITQDTHLAILNTLTQEGVAFGNLAAEAGNTAEGMKKLTQSIVETGVGYSRALGVPLQEVVSLQAEMAVEMGRSVEDTKQSFDHLTRSAVASGIAGNKFFSIVKAASADLSLWNLRLEGAVDLLGKLGKVLSPREAQKFFQTISTGFKSMGRQDLLKQTHFAGTENVRAALKEELAAQQDELAKQIIAAGGGAQFGEKDRYAKVLEKLQTGYRGADEMIRGVSDPSKVGTLRMKAAQAERIRQGVSGGTYEVSQASSDIEGIPRQMKIMTDTLERFGGSLSRPNEMGLAAVADNLNYSMEQVKQLNSIALAAEAERQLQLDRAKTEEDRKQIQAKTYSELIDQNETLKSMVDKFKEGDPKGPSVQDAIADMSKEQGRLTQSWTQKLENWVNWFMGAFYNTILDIWEALLKLLKWGSKEDIELKRVALESKSPLVQRAFADAKGDKNKFKGNLLVGGGEFSTRLRNNLARGHQKDATGADRKATQAVEGHILANTDKDAWLKAIGAVVKDPKRLEQIQDATDRQKSQFGVAGSLGGLGLSADEIKEVWNQVSWQMSPKSLAQLGEVMHGLGGADPSKEGTPATSPVQATADAVTTANTQLETIVQGNQQTNTTLTQQGIKIAPATLKEDAKGMEASMLSALRTALFEFYMYSGTDRGAMIASLREGGVTDPREVGQRFLGASVAGGGTLAGLNALGTKPVELPAHAMGGLVTGVANGLAVVAAEGEGLASVGRGERIVAAGGGGSGAPINVTVNGVGGSDLARLIEGKVVEGIREYKRREKFY